MKARFNMSKFVKERNEVLFSLNENETTVLLPRNEGITVLSLFDGISCGRVAFERAGIKVKEYYASEIDPHAIKITQTNYPDTVQLGDITKITETVLERVNINIYKSA